ncbi:MAG TPA: HEAT repeat domain-containing protein [Planctomycetaceae bacterium]|nr:HEAT repeat domain-containing protein [Planctomycetaceae bacterium]
MADTSQPLVLTRAGLYRCATGLTLLAAGIAICAWWHYGMLRQGEGATALEDVPLNRVIVRLADKGEAAIPQLMGALGDDDSRVRRDAIFGLIRLGTANESVVAALRARLADDNPQVRGQAAIALGRTNRGSKESAALVARLFRDPNPNVRNSAAIALMEMGPAVTSVITALVDDSHPDIRLQALRVLRHFRGFSADAVTVLRRASTDSSPEIRESAILALLMDWQATLEETVLWTRDRNPIISGDAVASLPRFGLEGAAALPSLIAILESSPLPNELSHVLVTLRSLKLAARPAIPSLLRLLDSPADYDPVEIFETLADIGLETPALVPILLLYLNDESPYVSGRAGELLSLVDPKQAGAQARLIAANLRTRNVKSIRVSLSALRGMGPPAVVALPELIDLLESGYPALHEPVALVLARLGPEAAPAVPAIDARLGDAKSQSSLLIALIEAAAGIGSAATATTDHLVGIIRTAPRERFRTNEMAVNNRVRGAALMAGARIGIRRADYIESLKAALSSDSPSFRIAALRSVAIIGKDVGVSVDDLLPRLESADGVERLMAANAMIAVDGAAPRIAPALRDLLNDTDLEIRAAAAAALGNLGADGEAARPELVAALKAPDNFVPLTARVRQRSRARDYLDDQPRLSVAQAVQQALRQIDLAGKSPRETH